MPPPVNRSFQIEPSEKAVNKWSIISGTVNHFWRVGDGRDGVMLWLPTADALTRANYECFTPQARWRPTSLFTPRCYHGNWLHSGLFSSNFRLFFQISFFKNNKMASYLMVSVVKKCNNDNISHFYERNTFFCIILFFLKFFNLLVICLLTKHSTMDF